MRRFSSGEGWLPRDNFNSEFLPLGRRFNNVALTVNPLKLAGAGLLSPLRIRRRQFSGAGEIVFSPSRTRGDIQGRV